MLNLNGAGTETQVFMSTTELVGTLVDRSLYAFPTCTAPLPRNGGGNRLCVLDCRYTVAA